MHAPSFTADGKNVVMLHQDDGLVPGIAIQDLDSGA